MTDLVHKITIISQATDPIYIGTGGFTIGRVDNTIVRDPITNIPKIPGSSIAGTWRYYMALCLHGHFKDEYKNDLKKRGDENETENLFESNEQKWVIYKENKYAQIKCAGQDDSPQSNTVKDTDTSVKESGHCGRCIVCKTFGYSKGDESRQGLALFSDLNIILFPVATRLGVRWITSPMLLKGIVDNVDNPSNEEKILINNNNGINHLNLGWLNFEVENNKIGEVVKKINNIFIENNIVIVHDNIIAQIINANLEVRTSVSIDPLTGAAKEGALFTSEAIPRGTIFSGEIRVMNKQAFPSQTLPDDTEIKNALEKSKSYFETLGIGGMTTRGFGRMKVDFEDDTVQPDNDKSDSPKQSTEATNDKKS